MKKIFYYFLVIFVCSCATGRIEKKVDHGEANYTRELDKVVNALDSSKNFEGIIKLYKERQEDFNTPELMFYVIRAHFYMGQYREAIGMIENYQKIFKKIVLNDIQLVKMLGISYYKIGNFYQAQRFLEIALENSDSEEIIKYLSLVYLKKGQYSLALMIATKLPDEKRIYIQGLVYTRMKNWQKALDLFEQIKYKNRKAYVLTGYCHYMMGNIEEAEKVISDPVLKDDSLSQIIMALIMVERGHVNKGKLMLEELRKQQSNASYIACIEYDLDLINEVYLGYWRNTEKEYLNSKGANRE